MKRLFTLSLLVTAVHASMAAARGEYCGRIKFDCDAHVATVGNMKSPLDCGVSTPTNFLGRIQQTSGKAVGSRWRCLKGKPKIDIGLGPVIIHTPCGNRSPKGQNQMFSGSGCLNVNQAMLNRLLSCKGASFNIKYACKWDSRTRYARRHQSRPTQMAYRNNGGASF